MARDTTTTSITVKRKSPFKQLALTISANDNSRVGAKGVRSFTPFRNPAPAVRMFNAYDQVGQKASNTNSPHVGKYLDPK